MFECTLAVDPCVCQVVVDYGVRRIVGIGVGVGVGVSVGIIVAVGAGSSGGSGGSSGRCWW